MPTDHLRDGLFELGWFGLMTFVWLGWAQEAPRRRARVWLGVGSGRRHAARGRARRGDRRDHAALTAASIARGVAVLARHVDARLATASATHRATQTARAVNPDRTLSRAMDACARMAACSAPHEPSQR